MTISPMYTVWCDAEHDDACTCPRWIAESSTRTGAWNWARNCGWVARNEGGQRRHYSPACARITPDPQEKP